MDFMLYYKGEKMIIGVFLKQVKKLFDYSSVLWLWILFIGNRW